MRLCTPASVCFNPCFDGSVARAFVGTWAHGRPSFGFNPCFDGSVARVGCKHRGVKRFYFVSILVLMEV